MHVLKDFDQSRFWKRLDDLSSAGSYSGDKESLDHLKASVRKVASRAKWINSQVESLYGDHGLCIRELLQNALDALELRELRLKMKQKGEAREPVDGHLIRPGWVREPDGREEELRVTLDWGTDEETGQQWLRVTDNGVGMTEEVIKNYFTQIGKSFYRSPEFNQERAAMKAAGEVVSPISIV